MQNLSDVENILKQRYPHLGFQAYVQRGPEEPYQDFPTHWIEAFGVDVHGQRDFLKGVRDLRPAIDRVMGGHTIFIFMAQKR